MKDAYLVQEVLSPYLYPSEEMVGKIDDSTKSSKLLLIFLKIGAVKADYW